MSNNKNVEYSPTRNNNKAGPIVIKAKSPIDPKKGTYSITPNIHGDIQVVDNYIILWPEDGVGFSEDKQYTATFKGYRTSSNKPLKIPKIIFSVNKSISYSNLQKEVLKKYPRFEKALNPFLEKLPYTQPYRFKVSYHINEQHRNDHNDDIGLLGDAVNWREKKHNYTVIIETLVTQGRGDSEQVYIQDTQTARQEALDWIKQQGVDVTKDIIYEFVPNDRALNSPETNSSDFDI